MALKQQFLYRNREIGAGFGLSLLSGFTIDCRFHLNSIRCFLCRYSVVCTSLNRIGLPVQCGLPAFADADNGISIEETADAVKTEPVIYTKTGEALKPESGANLSVSV